jgi:hypothetical protein
VGYSLNYDGIAAQSCEPALVAFIDEQYNKIELNVHLWDDLSLHFLGKANYAAIYNSRVLRIERAMAD